ncbi:hypothetical protein ACR78F_11800 [Sphingobacterium spiritivorum]|uniref:hypothetical protein n=1 Tax=Sphingobacterium spiritivorum TaxID=258 RepID=UPI003DA265B1
MLKYLSYLIIFLVANKVVAQDLSRLTIQTPTAAALGRYETVPVDESTGVPQISIPLFSFRVGDVEFPVTLSYHAGGVKVDQLESQVGLSWSLLGFPNMSRNIRGIPDENSRGGYLRVTPVTNEEIEKRAQNLAPYNYGTYANHAFLSDLKAGLNYDLSPDIFNYSLRKGGGKFVYTRDREFVTIPFRAIKVKHNIVSGNVRGVTFSLRDEGGLSYDFNSWNYTVSDNQPMEGTNPFSLFAASSWNVTKIRDANARDSALFTYQRSYIDDYIYSERYVIGTAPVYISSSNNGFSRGLQEYSTPLANVEEQEVRHLEDRVTEIRTGGELCKFTYTSNFLSRIEVFNSMGTLVKSINFRYNEGIPAANRTYLTSVSFNENAEGPEKYKFYYNDQALPDRRRAFGQDYWGYYNGASNMTLIPITQVRMGEFYKEGAIGFQNQIRTVGSADRNPSEPHRQAGMLKRIVYPTGAERVFHYSSNYYSRTMEKKIRKQVGGRTNGKGKFVRSENTYLIKAINPTLNFLNAKYSLKLDLTYSPPMPRYAIIMGEEEHPQNVFVIDKSNSSIIYSGYHNSNPDLPLTVAHDVDLDPGKEYELKVVVYGDINVTTANGYPATYVDVSASWEELKTETSNALVDGMKVDKIEDFDRGQLLSTKTYSYSSPYVAFQDRLFYKNYQDLKIITPKSAGWFGVIDFLTYFQRHYFASSSFSTIPLMGSSVIYKNVKSVIRDSFNGIADTVTSTYDVFHEPVQETVGDFITGSSSYAQFAPNWIYVNLKNSKVGRNAAPKRESVYDYSSLFKIIPQIDEFRIVYSDAEYRHDDVAAPVPFNILSMSSFRLRSFPVSRSSSLLVKKTESMDGVSQAEEYGYSLADLQQNSVTRQTGTAAKRVMKTQYPNDVSSMALYGGNLRQEEFSAIQQLIASNQLDRPIQQETYVGNRLTGFSRNTYEQANGFPLYKRSYEKNRAEDDMIIKVEVLSYDRYGNPLAVKKTDGPVISYLWGYNGQYPVAEIVNAHYNDVVSAIGGQSVVDALNSGTVTADYIRQKMEILRSNLPGSQITSYTYKPLVGMTSKTDAKGQTEYYQYDGLQRLQHVLDQFQQLRQSYHYHYRPQ